MNEAPNHQPGDTYRHRFQKGIRITYNPAWSQMLPWFIYNGGNAVTGCGSLPAAIQKFHPLKAKHWYKSTPENP